MQRRRSSRTSTNRYRRPRRSRKKPRRSELCMGYASLSNLVAVITRNGQLFRTVPRTLLYLRPMFVRAGPVLEHTGAIQDLPQLVSWPRDGGAFITLPAVYTEDADRPGWRHSNLGMYRVQLSGNQYAQDRE